MKTLTSLVPLVAAVLMNATLGCVAEGGVDDRASTSDSDLTAVGIWADTPTADKQLLVDAHDVYSIDGFGVDRLPTGAAPRKVIMSPHGYPRQLGQDATYVYGFDSSPYIPNTSGVWRVAKAGGAPQKLVTMTTNAWSPTGLIAIGDQEIFFSATFDVQHGVVPNVHGIFAIKKGATVPGIVDANNVLSNPGVRLVATTSAGISKGIGAIVDNRLYWLTGTSLYSVSTSGGPVDRLYGIRNDSLRDLRVVDGQLYFVEVVQDTKVRRFDPATSQLQLVTTVPGRGVSHLAGDNAGIYVATISGLPGGWNVHDFYRLNGGTATKVATWKVGSTTYVRDLALDSQWVYVAAGGEGIARIAR